MDMKSFMFAGAGLFLAMTATVLLMRGDVQRMRDQERAKAAKECAAQVQTDPVASPQASLDEVAATPEHMQTAAAADPAAPTCGQVPTDVAMPPGTDPVAATDPSMAATDPAMATTDPTLGGDPAMNADPNAVAGADPASTYPAATDGATTGDPMVGGETYTSDPADTGAAPVDGTVPADGGGLSTSGF